MRSSHGWSVDAVRFDEQSLVSCAGLVPVWSLAEQTGLTGLLERVRFETGPAHAHARGATLRRQLINVPARLVKPQRRPMLRLPTHWPHAQAWLNLWNSIFRATHAPPATA